MWSVANKCHGVVKPSNHPLCPTLYVGIRCSIKYRDNLYKQLLIILHESQDYLSLKNKLHDYNTILKKILRHAKKYTMHHVLM